MWWALLPTIVIALIIAGMALVPSRAKLHVDGAGAEREAKTAGPLPTFGGGVRELGIWIRDARKPVWPVDYRELNNRVKRGVKLAAVIALVVVAKVAGQPPNATGMEVLLFFGIGVTAVIFIAFASIASVIHSTVLQLLPWRGPIVSIALGTLLGLAAGYASRTYAGPNSTLIWSGVIYGLAMGFIEFSLPVQGSRNHVRG